MRKLDEMMFTFTLLVVASRWDVDHGVGVTNEVSLACGD
jgi:hypothetical protein